MAKTHSNLLAPVGLVARRVSAALIAGIWRGRDLADVERRLADQPLREQALIVGATLAALLCCAVLAAQFGWLAMLGFWLGVIVIVN